MEKRKSSITELLIVSEKLTNKKELKLSSKEPVLMFSEEWEDLWSWLCTTKSKKLSKKFFFDIFI